MAKEAYEMSNNAGQEMKESISKARKELYESILALVETNEQMENLPDLSDTSINLNQLRHRISLKENNCDKTLDVATNIFVLQAKRLQCKNAVDYLDEVLESLFCLLDIISHSTVFSLIRQIAKIFKTEKPKQQNLLNLLERTETELTERMKKEIEDTCMLTECQERTSSKDATDNTQVFPTCFDAIMALLKKLRNIINILRDGQCDTVFFINEQPNPKLFHLVRQSRLHIWITRRLKRRTQFETTIKSRQRKTKTKHPVKNV